MSGWLPRALREFSVSVYYIDRDSRELIALSQPSFSLSAVVSACLMNPTMHSHEFKKAWRAGGARPAPPARPTSSPWGRHRLHLHGLACLPSSQARLSPSMAWSACPPARSASPITVSSSPPGLYDTSHPSVPPWRRCRLRTGESSVSFQKDPHFFHPSRSGNVDLHYRPLSSPV